MKPAAQTPGNLQAEWARLLLGSFADAGVRDVVISPGSRSTPFVLAAAEHPKLRLVDVVDERSAAFFALGQARVTGRPTLLLATSGTAGANYFPAVIEAGASHTPLLILTSDRPPELQACGANQTIDQLKLFGAHAREFFELGTPDPSPGALRALRRIAAQAFHASRAPRPGAVQLNARARTPLEPGEAGAEGERDLAARVSALLEHPAPRPLAPRLMAEPAHVDELVTACRRARRGLIVCGPAPLHQARTRSLIAELARRTGFPVLREAASQVRYCGELAAPDVVAVDAFDALLKCRRFRSTAAPDMVLQIGRVPTSGAWGSFMAEHAGCPHWVLGPDGWNDSESTATHLLFSELESCLARLTTRLPPGAAESSWAARFRAAEVLAQAVVDRLLEDLGELSEGAVARKLVAALPAGSLLALGNSLPIRQVDTYACGPGVDLRVVCQRGASGIDGVVSGAVGAATVWRHPVALSVGDLSFLHDLSGLQAARYASVPMVIVVVQNRGGRIFEQLPLAAHPAGAGDVFEHWTTPHDFDLGPAAAMAGLAYARAKSGAELEQALAAGLGRVGVTVIEAIVPPHGAAEQDRRLRQELDAALARADEA